MKKEKSFGVTGAVLLGMGSMVAEGFGIVTNTKKNADLEKEAINFIERL